MAKIHSRHAAETKRRRRRWNRGDLAIMLCGVLAFLSITFGAPLISQPSRVPGGAVESMASGVPVAEPAPIAVAGTPAGTTAPPRPAAGSVAQPQLPEAAQPRRIRYPSAAFDVPVHPLELDGAAQSSQTIVPPATKDGYWLTPFGTPGQGSANTTYVIGHSWEGAEAPFNNLSSAAAVGDLFQVETAMGTISYRVDSVTTYLKSSLKDSPIWEIVPNRLVLISCFTEDPWGKNVVITASPAVS
ncbi:class F sortase [Pseudarthrobacter phenanthrenivorans]|uniref:class F sortase n=1 Tax=Pseudarthrobacter phenanthrenivorans TaxID=361575 RepID=UPI00112A3C66|nr:class F sortase [Pseudarthrobacter phenanthrenivorans]TPV49781.1 class F sortase [Pseudarthrobacter phenanthrenivorans]